MRRQVKPFVTEYRGSPRRKDLPSTGDLQPELQAPRARSFADAERAFHSDSSEDSYEAALRAADALFAVSPSDTTSAYRAPRSSATPPPSFVGAAADEVFTVESTSPSATIRSEECDTMAPPRRILQAIEAPAEDRFAALEAERAPKRRGRKPGSKNKPKIVVGDDWLAPLSRPALAIVQALPVAARVPSTRPASVPVPTFSEVVEMDKVDGRRDDDMVMPQPRGRTDKFGWKRDGLRPGERWKRRLPKAAR